MKVSSNVYTESQSKTPFQISASSLLGAMVVISHVLSYFSMHCFEIFVLISRLLAAVELLVGEPCSAFGRFAAP